MPATLLKKSNYAPLVPKQSPICASLRYFAKISIIVNAMAAWWIPGTWYFVYPLSTTDTSRAELSAYSAKAIDWSNYGVWSTHAHTFAPYLTTQTWSHPALSSPNRPWIHSLISRRQDPPSTPTSRRPNWRVGHSQRRVFSPISGNLPSFFTGNYC